MRGQFPQLDLAPLWRLVSRLLFPKIYAAQWVLKDSKLTHKSVYDGVMTETVHRDTILPLFFLCEKICRGLCYH